MTWRWASVKAQLPQAAEINGVAQNAHGLLRGMEAHRVLRHDEINHELTPAMIIASRSQLRVRSAILLSSLDVSNQVDQRIECRVAQREEAILDV